MACPAHDAILTRAATAAVVAAEDDGPRLNATLSATGDRAERTHHADVTPAL